jgi:hypothetical protein
MPVTRPWTALYLKLLLEGKIVSSAERLSEVHHG